MAVKTLVSNVAVRVASQPVLKSVAGKPLAEFRVARDDLRRSGDTWERAGTDFFTVEWWGKGAENLAASITVGAPLVICGEILHKAFINKDGEAALGTVVRADIVAPDFRRARMGVTWKTENGGSAQDNDIMSDPRASEYGEDIAMWATAVSAATKNA